MRRCPGGAAGVSTEGDFLRRERPRSVETSQDALIELMERYRRLPDSADGKHSFLLASAHKAGRSD